MKFAAAFAVAAAALLSLAGLVAGQDLFPDKNLDAAVRQQVFEKRNNDMPLVEADVVMISTIKAIKGKTITNLAGLEKCKSLAELDLARNEIVDLTPLKDLKMLQSLQLQNNKIESIAPLSELTGLQFLYLQNNKVSDVSPLAKMSNLSSLDLDNNQVKDISPLASCTKLHALNLRNNPVADIKPLAALVRLERLWLAGANAADLTPLAGLTELKFLGLEKCQISDLTVLIEMGKKDLADRTKTRFAPFWHIYLKGNPLSDQAKAQVEELRKVSQHVEVDKFSVPWVQ